MLVFHISIHKSRLRVARYNRPTLAKLLVQKGAMVDAVDNAGETATDIANRLKWKKVKRAFPER